LFGKIGIPDRWNKYQELVKELNLDNIICKTSYGVDHKRGSDIMKYIPMFLSEILNNLSPVQTGKI
jgi:hypothetical protein